LLIHHSDVIKNIFLLTNQTLKTKNGELTNVTYGVASMLIAILKQEQPTHLIFCFDEGEETFRHQQNDTYKDGRAETPDEFYTQIPRVMNFIEAFGVTRVSHPNYEADDFLCAYAKEGEKQGMKVTIVTGDRDAFQLATDHTRIAIPHKGYMAPEYLGPKEILAKYGVRPDQIASYKGLTGDPSDNLPGVKGIGPKGAADLLQRFDTLKGIYEHLDEVKPGVREKLKTDEKQAFFCEHMAQLVCDFDLPVPLKDAALQDIPTEAVMTFFRDIEFMTLSKRLQGLSESEYGKKHFVQLVVQEVPRVQVAMKKVEKSEDQLTMF
jgi:DNA polymerase-1